MKKFFTYLFLTLILGGMLYGIGYLIVGMIIQKPNIIIKQNSEYLWVKKYTLYNKDSCICKYHQPIIYEGTVTYCSSHWVGVPGKGGHMVYETSIEYDGNKEYVESGFRYFSDHEKGMKVNVKVTFYPYKKVEVLN